MRLHYKFLLVAAFLLSTALAFRGCRPHKPILASSTPSQVLPLQDLAKVSVSDHKVVTTTSSGTTTKYVPNDVTIEVTKLGQVDVEIKEIGLEHRFFFGTQISDQGRFCAGLDLWYWNRLDLGIGVGGEPGMHTPIIFAKASWMVWQQLQFGLTYDNLQHVGIALTVKI